MASGASTKEVKEGNTWGIHTKMAFGAVFKHIIRWILKSFWSKLNLYLKLISLNDQLLSVLQIGSLCLCRQTKMASFNEML